MATSFDLSARLKLVGPYGTKAVVSALKRELKTVKGAIDFKISPVAAKNLGTLNKALDVFNRNITRVSSNAQHATYSIDQLGKSFSQFGVAAKTNNASINTTVKQLNQVKSSAHAAGSEIQNFGKSAGLAVKRFAAFTLATGTIFGFIAAIAKASKEAIDFQDDLVKIAQVTNNSVDGIRGLGDEISNLAVKYGASSKDLRTVSLTLSQAGLSARETKQALESLAKSSLAPSFTDIGNTTEGLISILGQFKSELNGVKLGVKDFDNILGSINAVSKDFAVEADDIVTAIRGAGSVFAQASEGIDKPTESLNKLIALFTSVRATTRESAESISTGLRTIFARIQRGSTIDFLRQFGIELTDLEGKFVGPFEAVRRLNEGLKDLDPKDTRYSQIAEELGGIRQLSKLLPLIRQFPVALEAYDSAQKGTNSTTEDAIKAQQSLLVQFRRVREEFLRLVKDVLHTDSFSSLAKNALDFASTLIKVASAIKSIAPYLALALGISAAKGGAQFLTGFKQAFTGGGAKTLAGGAGSAVGGALGGTTTVKNTASLDANTLALKQLTLAIGVRGAAGAYPKGLHFAKGGIVPGHGNKDTVPAMLTPGEMIIPKRFVTGGEVEATYPGRKILPKVLAQIVAAGDSGWKQKAEELIGKPKTNTPKGNDIIAGSNSLTNPTVAGLFLQPEAGDLRTIRNRKTGSYSGTTRVLAQQAGATSGEETAYYPFHAAFIEPSQAGKLKKDMNTLIKNSVRTIVQKYGGGGTINVKDRDDIIQTSNLAGAGGSLFEAFVHSLGSKFQKNDSAATWDTTPGAFGSGLKNLFGPIPASIKHIDIKLTANESGYNSLKDKTDSQIGLNQTGFGFHPYGGQQGDKYDTISKSAFSKSIGNKTLKPKGFATGGAARGTDTIPAMLTPGEYVINRKSASKIGRDKLDQLNHYATGGIVKDNPLFNHQSFSSLSTNPQLAQKTGIQKLNFLDKFQRAFDGLSPTAQQLTKALNRYIQLINKGISSEDALTRVQVALTKVQAKQAQAYASQISGGTAASGRTLRTRGFGKTSIFDSLAGSQSLIGRGYNSLTKQRFGGEQTRNRFNTGAFYAGVGLSTAGAAISANAKTSGSAGLGGGLTGAGAGIAAGSQLGPVGAIAGGLIGGLTGFRNGIDEFNKSKALKNTEISLAKLDEAISEVTENMSAKNVEDFNKSLRSVGASKLEEYEVESNAKKFAIGNAFASGGNALSFGGNAEGNRRGREALGGTIPALFASAEALNKAKITSVKADINEIFADMETQAKQAEDLIKAAAAKGDFETAERIAVANTRVLNVRDADFKKKITDKAGTYTDSDKAQIANEIEREALKFRKTGGSKRTDSIIAIEKEATRLKEAFTKANQEVDLLVNNLNNFTAGLDRGVSILDKFAQANDSILAQLQGNFSVGKSNRDNPFANLDAYSTKEIRSAGSQLGSSTIAQGVLSGKILSEILPAALQKLSAREPNENLESQFSGILNEQESLGVVLPEEIRKAIEAAFKAELTTRKAGDNIDKLQTPGFSNDLLKPFQAFNDAAKKVFDLRVAAEHKYVDEINKIAQTREIVEARQTDIDKTRSEVTRRSATASGRDLTFGEATAGVRAKYTRLTATPGFLGRPETRNPDASTLAREIIAASSAQQAITNKGALSPADIAEQARLGKFIKDNTEALNILKDSTEVLAAIESERSKIEKKKEVGRGIADKVFGGGIRGRIEFARQAQAVQAFRAGDNRAFTGNEQAYNDLKAGIEQLVQVLKVSGKGAEAKALEAEFDRRRGIGDFSKEEGALDKAEASVGATQLAAAEALKKVAEVSLPTMITNANTAFVQLQVFLNSAITKLEGGVPRRAAGGYISGPGGPRGDKIPAMLSDGEYVINAAAASRLGPERLNALNSVHLATGGRARRIARQQGISLRDARAQLRSQHVNQQYQRTLAYVNRSRAGSAELEDYTKAYSLPGNPAQPGDVFNIRSKLDSGVLSKMRNVQRYGRNVDRFRKRGHYADGGPVSAGGNVASGIASAMGQFQSSVLLLSQSINKLAEINIPSNITMTGHHTHEVIINGAAVLQNLEPLVIGMIDGAIKETLQKHIPLQNRMEGVY